MNNFKRFININQKNIFYIIIIMVLIIIIVSGLNYYYLKKEDENQKNIIDNNITIENGYVNENNVKIEDINTKETKELQSNTLENTMKKFVSYCNNKSITDAYNMLSEECKKELFSTEDEFNNKYLKKIFTNKKDYNIEAWKNTSVGVTYRVTYVDDILSTGKVGTNTEDYITVDGNGKLNIFRFIGSEKLNKSASNDIATIQILDKVVYDDYEKYSIRVTNNTKNTIMINRKEDNDGIYTVYSGSSEKYSAFISEIYEGKVKLKEETVITEEE